MRGAGVLSLDLVWGMSQEFLFWGHGHFQSDKYSLNIIFLYLKREKKNMKGLWDSGGYCFK